MSTLQEISSITAQQVLVNNLSRHLALERQRVEIAKQKFHDLIGAAVNSSDDWNPVFEKMTMMVIVEAENALREIDGCKQAKGIARPKLYGSEGLWKLQALKVQQQGRKLWGLFQASVQSFKAYRLWKRIVD